MMRINWWLPVVAAVVILWHECGENFAVFCYRIGMTLCARSGEIFLPGAAQRVPVACSNPCFTSCAPSTTRKGLNR